nr:aldo/keto reductase [Streptomyces sp. ERV7]
MIPAIGFGTWQLKGDYAYRVVSLALEAGYRHLDTAALYGSEEAVGKALAASSLPRAEVFVTTKFAQRRPGGEREALERSLGLLGLDHVDLWLVHFPLKDPYENITVWDAFLAATDERLATGAGVSNHSLPQLDALTAQPHMPRPSTRSGSTRPCTTRPSSKGTPSAGWSLKGTAHCDCGGPDWATLPSSRSPPHARRRRRRSSLPGTSRTGSRSSPSPATRTASRRTSSAPA